MPHAVSKKQFRMMQAILHGAKPKTARGDSGPPKSVAAQYVHEKGKDKSRGIGGSLPESKGKEHEGGKWSSHHKEKDKKRVQSKRTEHKKAKSKRTSKKSLEKTDHVRGSAAMLLLDNNGRILLGEHVDGGLAFPGGRIDLSDLDAQRAAARETKEETGIDVDSCSSVWESGDKQEPCVVFVADKYSGEPQDTDELKNLKWHEPHLIEWGEVRDCCIEPLKHFLKFRLGKSLKGMIALESLEKNIVRQKPGAVLEVTHGDALRLIGTGLFRKLKEVVSDMKDEDFKDAQFDTYTVKIRRHMSDVYSGNVVDGSKVIYQFTNKSLPELTAALMSVFEWYLPEDEDVLNMIDEENISDDAVHSGLGSLIENYKRHNIGNIYEEMENIRREIRNGAVIDVQQVEARIMKLFDKLEETMHVIAGKHNTLKDLTEKELEELDKKLRELQSRIDEMGKKPEVIEAITTQNKNPEKIYRDEYPYLPKPQIEISPNGKIRITFDSEWTSLEKENFLHDLRAKALKKEKR